MHRLIAIVSLALTGSLPALEPVIIRPKEGNPSLLTLTWPSGKAPFVIEQSSDLMSWIKLGETNEFSFTLPQQQNPQNFFRVSSPLVPDLGEKRGEWRVAQGEFGNALAKHRLKSIWQFYFPEGQSNATARDFFTKANLRIDYLDGQERKVFTGRFEDLPEASISTESEMITVDWTWGEGESKRDLSLEMAFRYGIDGIRFQPINLSDPTVTLRAHYESPVITTDRSGQSLTTTQFEEVTLVEVDEAGEAPGWWQREIHFTKGGVTIHSRFQIGVPLFEGSPAFIFKTPLLVQWEGTTISGLTTKPIELRHRFSQTYFPGHHNFIETLWLQPSLEPGIDSETLSELEALNIRFIIPSNPSAFPEQEPSLRVLGSDKQFRTL